MISIASVLASTVAGGSCIYDCIQLYQAKIELSYLFVSKMISCMVLSLCVLLFLVVDKNGNDGKEI